MYVAVIFISHRFKQITPINVDFLFKFVSVGTLGNLFRAIRGF